VLGKPKLGIEITGSMLEAQFQVTPETGDVRRLSRGGNWLDASWTAWNGYRLVSFPLGNKKYHKIRAHHLVWVWATGAWPKGEIDHINGDRSDNRIENLREVTVSQNRTNKKIQSNNKSGFKWVHFCKQRGLWCAEICAPRAMGIGRKRLHQSFHVTAKEAHEAALKTAQKLHGEFFNPG